MSSIKPLYCLLNINLSKYSKSEIMILEAELFYHIHQRLIDIFRLQQKNFSYLIKLTKEEEQAMLDANFARFIILDTLLTNHYTLAGIAYYTNSHEDVVQDIASGQNKNPSVILIQKLLELHRSVRAELYQEIIEKILEDLSIKTQRPFKKCFTEKLISSHTQP